MGRTTDRIAIVGASAAGVYAAGLLARAGRDVVVYERAPRLDPQPRTLIVTHRYRDVLGALGERAVRNEVRHFELYADGRTASVTLERPDLIIERATLIRDLAGDAARNGARIEAGRRFLGLAATRGGLDLELAAAGERRSPERVAARALVGADGARSAVARCAGWPLQPTVPVLQAIVDLPADCPPDTARVWFRPDDTPYFYWLIPESADRGALGVIGVDGPRTRASLERFMAATGLRPRAWQAARIPEHRRWTPMRRRVGGGEVWLVGDAAGQVKVSTVGGIVTGLRGARAVAGALAGGDGHTERRALRRELALHRAIRRALGHFTEDDYRALLGLLDADVRRRIGAHSRDEAARMLFDLVRARPRLVLLGLRGLVAGLGARPGRPGEGPGPYGSGSAGDKI